MATAATLARGLGLFSLALGVSQVAAPRAFGRLIGVRPRTDRATATRAVGVRELGAAAGLLTSRRPVTGMWMRVAGDLMDIALLRRAIRHGDTQTARAGAVFASVVAITVVDVVGSVLLTREARSHHRNGRKAGGSGIAGLTDDAGQTYVDPADDNGDGAERGRIVARTATVWRPVEEVYRFWRDFENFPSFMHHLEEVRVFDPEGRRSHWRAKGPLGTSVEWDAELTEDVANERIAWRSLRGSQVRNGGIVRFEPTSDGRGTVVRVEFEYDPPGGPLGVAIAKLSGEEPATQAAQDLRRLKQVLELGEVVVSEATMGGRRVRQRPAQPDTSEPDLAAAQ